MYIRTFISDFLLYFRIRREEEAKRIFEQLQLEEAERKRAEEALRQRLLFQRGLNLESHGMEHSQDLSRAFVFSYYELLRWLGYEVPQWAQYGPVDSNPPPVSSFTANPSQHDEH